MIIKRCTFVATTLIFILLMRLDHTLTAKTVWPRKGPNSNSQDTSSISLQDPPKLKQQPSSLYFLTPRAGWLLRNHSLYSTKDGGKTWSLINNAVEGFEKVLFLNEEKGWAIRDEWGTEKRSNSIFHTQDGGRSWHKILELPTPIYTMDFPSRQIGYVWSRWLPAQLTLDGGKTWRELKGQPEGLNYVFFIDEKKAWGYGGGIWHTSDGGQTWIQDVSDDLVEDLHSAKFVNNSVGFIVGNRGQIWRMTSEKAWERIMILPATNDDLYDVDFISQQEGWITAENGAVLHTIDGGRTWKAVTRWSFGITAIKFITTREGWALDNNNNVLHTMNGGRNWRVVKNFEATEKNKRRVRFATRSHLKQ